MKKQLILWWAVFFWLNLGLLKAQVTTDPLIFTANQAVTITYDASQSAGQQLANLPSSVTTITAHVGAILVANGTTWTNVPGTWGDPNATPKFTRQGTSNIYTLSLPNGIRSMFPALAAPNNTPIFRVGMVFRENGPCGGFGTPPATTNCREGKSNLGQDIFLNVNQGQYDIAFTHSVPNNSFVNINDNISLNVVSNVASTLTIRVNGAVVATQTNVTQLNHNLVISTGATTFKVEAIGTQGSNTITRTISYLIRQEPSTQAVPAGLRDGINYNPNDASRVTLVLTAPEKRAVYVIGDFNDWNLDNAYLMKRVPNYGGSGAGSNPTNNKFWLEITGLTPNQEYGFQYWVYDNSNNLVRITDPYCEKILDVFDNFIPTTTYPNLKPYPTGQQGAVGILQTGRQPYPWSQATLNFQKPDKRRLNIYEAWVHDFDVNRNFQNLIDRLDYLQNLGINALQLMPIMEFNGNISWGYNTTFFCALDKAYGSKDKFKELVDKCHQRGIAVILDIALNHAEFEFPGCKMYWNAALNRPAANNPWFNQVATHPFSVFQDFNHESPYTREFTERVIKYWIEEYKIDGYRYDLAKGLTQTNSGTCDPCVGAWNQYDASRVAIIKRIADWQWQADPRSYVILEFLATGGAEEAEYANYRINDPILGGTAQGGMMLWRNMESNYAQNIMGFTTNHFLGDADFANNPGGGGVPFQQPRVVSYMESHDEERVMYKAITFGNQSNPAHNVRNLNTALKRVEPAILFHAPITGPKMMWQFGELGYDITITRCTNATFNNSCRIDPKPIPFTTPLNYDQVTARMDLYRFYAAVNQLKLKYDAFMAADVYIREDNGPTKMLKITPQPFNANPTNPNLTNIVIIANFGVTSQNVIAEFHTTGTWYSYFQNNAVFNATSLNQSINLGPGEYRLFTQVPLIDFTSIPNAVPSALTLQVQNITQVLATWTNTITNNTGIRVKRRVVGNPNFTIIATLPANATSFVDATVAENTQYEYQIEAFNLNGVTNSTIANITTPTFPPLAPSNLILTNLTANAASFLWTDNSSDEIGFILQRRTGSGSYADIGSLTNANVTTTTDNTIASGNTYTYRVGAVKGTGSNEVRVYSNEVGVSTAIPNATPSGLVANATSSTAVTLNWTDASTNSTGVRILRATTGNFITLVTLAANTINYIDNTVSENTAYSYKVEIFNIFGTSESNTANVTTPLTPPTAPSNLRILDQQFDGITRIYSVELTWNDNANNEQNYLVQRSTDANTGFVTLATLPANATTYTDNTITTYDVIYYYRVIARRSTIEVPSNVVNTGIISALDKAAADKLISISPNPSNERIEVFVEKIFVPTKVQIINIQGKMIDNLSVMPSQCRWSYDLQHLSNGQYMVQVFGKNGQVVSKKFVKVSR